jgi:hypothetical protein
MAGTDDKIIPFEIELLDGHGEKGKIISVRGGCLWKMLNERGFDIHPFDDIGQLVLHIEEGKEIRLRIELAEDLEAFLSSPHACEPIMN